MLYACHCSDCQKQSSSAFGMSLLIDRDRVDFGDCEDRLKFWDTRGDDGSLKRCAFCARCGSRIFHASEGDDEPISIKAGSLDDTGCLRPVAHIWLQSRQPWIDLNSREVACFDREPDDEQQLERLWRQQAAARRES